MLVLALPNWTWAEIPKDLTDQRLTLDTVIHLDAVKKTDQASQFLLLNSKDDTALFITCGNGGWMDGGNWVKIQVTDRAYTRAPVLAAYYESAENCAKFYEDALAKKKSVGIQFGEARRSYNEFLLKYHEAMVSAQ